MSHGKCTKHNSGVVEWTQHGLLHRGAGKPACIYDSGRIFWYVKGSMVTHTRDYCAEMKYDDHMTAFMILKYGEKLPDDVSNL